MLAWGLGNDLLSTSASLHMWSPIMEISIWRPHEEHFIVGNMADSRGTAMSSGSRLRPFNVESSYEPATWASHKIPSTSGDRSMRRCRPGRLLKY